MKNSPFHIFFFFAFIVVGFREPEAVQGSLKVEWTLFEFVENPAENIIISGQPAIVPSPYGKSVLFNGRNDGIFLETTPLLGLDAFTVEVIMRPDTNGLREQRFLHFGETNADRMLLETRLNNDRWYLDAHIRSGDARLTLIDSTKLHPLNEWHHVACVYENGRMTTFVNGKKELEGTIANFTSLASGKTSIGVRQDRRDWYKGAMYKIKVTPRPLSPGEFLPFTARK